MAPVHGHLAMDVNGALIHCAGPGLPPEQCTMTYMMVNIRVLPVSNVHDRHVYRLYD